MQAARVEVLPGDSGRAYPASAESSRAHPGAMPAPPYGSLAQLTIGLLFTMALAITSPTGALAEHTSNGTFDVDPLERVGPGAAYVEIPRAALLGDLGLAVWQSLNEAEGRVYTARFRLDGEVIDQPALVVTAHDSIKIKGVDVCASDDRFAIVWGESIAGFPSTRRTYRRSMWPDGTFVEAGPQHLTYDSYWPQCHCDDPGVVIFWFSHMALFHPNGQRLTPIIELGGTILKTIAWNGSQYLLSYRGMECAGHGLGYQRLDAELEPVGACDSLDTWNAASAVVATGEDWLLAWKHELAGSEQRAISWGRVPPTGSIEPNRGPTRNLRSSSSS